jgi:hypothetical protein
MTSSSHGRWYLVAIFLSVSPAAAQIDQKRAESYFQEAAALCAREGGRLWGVSLCGPMVFADPSTHTIATSQPPPNAPRPSVLGFANTAVEWGGTRWTTIVWTFIPESAEARGRLMLHELFHRVQPRLGFLTREGDNSHLDTLEGRYWLQLEWRALAKSLKETGAARSTAIADALAFRQARRKRFPDAAENEQSLEINEGLAHYTGTVAAAASIAEAIADVIDQLTRAPAAPSFVRTFAYPLGSAYGILLDATSPGWTRKVKPSDDLGELLQAATRAEPIADLATATARYGGAKLRAVEEKRDVEHRARVAELRHRFVEGPVLKIPASGNASFDAMGMTSIPDAGTVYSQFRVTTVWGSLDAKTVLWSVDRKTLTLPAPSITEATTLKGDDWTLNLASGWVVRPAARPGDCQIVWAPNNPPARP